MCSIVCGSSIRLDTEILKKRFEYRGYGGTSLEFERQRYGATCAILTTIPIVWTSPQGPRAGFLKDCDDYQDGQTYTLCRKIDMYLDMDFGEQHPAENRIHRACGYMENETGKECYYKSGYNTRSWVCACKTDDCNSSFVTSPQVFAILFCMGAALISTFMNTFSGV
ncbi:hypothetical protein Anas_03505 [Armadillidium nasatum]|uniref:Uncharacterized protein n=1 Tax=Armadillidium nasatum TaxID=96803 RepID=A0A5N5TH56_9CRUS|nr:hypothetical protein Anas_03505 [Armadillidium nasatum]